MYKQIHNNDNPGSLLIALKGETGCCGDNAGTEAKYSFTTDFANAFTAISIGGTNYAFSSNATNASELVARVNEAFTKANFLDTDYSGIQTFASGVNTIVAIFSTVVVDNLTHTGGSQAVATSTTKYYLCDYKITMSDNPGQISVNDSAPAALANVPYPYSETDQAANETQRAQLETDFATVLTAQGIANPNVSVKINTVAKAYDVTAESADGTQITVGPLFMVRGDCRVDFS